MKLNSRTVALVSGFLLLLPALALVLVGVGAGIAGTHQDEDGYVSSSLGEVGSDGAAVIVADPAALEPTDVPDWARELVSLDVRVVADSGNDRPIFLGAADPGEVREYLEGVAHTEITDVQDGRLALFGGLGDPVLTEHTGPSEAERPADEEFWSASVSGSGPQTLDWDITDGASAVVLMHADGTPGVAANITLAIRTWPMVPVAAVVLLLGLVVLGTSTALCVWGARGADRTGDAPTSRGFDKEPAPVTDVTTGVS